MWFILFRECMPLKTETCHDLDVLWKTCIIAMCLASFQYTQPIVRFVIHWCIWIFILSALNPRYNVVVWCHCSYSVTASTALYWNEEQHGFLARWYCELWGGPLALYTTQVLSINIFRFQHHVVLRHNVRCWVLTFYSYCFVQQDSVLVLGCVAYYKNVIFHFSLVL